MNKLINIILILSIIMIIISVIIDLMPNTFADTTTKLLIYIFAMFIAFINMKVQLRQLNEDSKKEKIRKKFLILILIIYSILLTTLLLFDSNYGRFIFSNRKMQIFSKEHFQLYSNFIPFKTIYTFIERFFNGTINKNIVVTNILGNIIAFAPFGILIPIIFKEKFNNIKNFTLLMIGIILCVEIIQFITLKGTFDVDDLILNLLGTIITYSLIKIKKVRKILNYILN